jgi:cyclopropane fatty-acyl-phospholipid synthase-like methyltransferase
MSNIATSWKDFWDSFPNQFEEDEFLRQVGKTFQGQPISKEQVDVLVSDIVQKLNLKDDDEVLDLCCGNGLLTSKIAGKCRRITGVDFSPPLIAIANRYHRPLNTRYYCLSALDITAKGIEQSRPFTKIYMYEGLQHFQEEQLSHLIGRILALSNAETVILLASIPHRQKLSKYYYTPQQQREYRQIRRKGFLGLGTWWSQSKIRDICAAYNLRCEFLPQPLCTHTAHYRFDVRIKKR